MRCAPADVVSLHPALRSGWRWAACPGMAGTAAGHRTSSPLHRAVCHAAGSPGPRAHAHALGPPSEEPITELMAPALQSPHWPLTSGTCSAGCWWLQVTQACNTDQRHLRGQLYYLCQGTPPVPSRQSAIRPSGHPSHRGEVRTIALLTQSKGPTARAVISL